MSRRLVRSIRNISSTPSEVKIKSATSNDPFGPTASELNDIAVLTFSTKSLKQITTILNKRLNDKSRNWRHVLKSLTVIEYCTIAGSTEFVSWIQKNQFLITTLKEFEVKDNSNVEIQIRQKASNISKLLKDSVLLQDKRSKFHIYRNKMAQPSAYKRSSLDVTRDDLEVEQTIERLPEEFQRGTKSLEISRHKDRDDHYNMSPRIRPSLDLPHVLDNIVEE